jgi:tRNA threonylcarbamoyladenosine biosynthesis protein TsaE
MRLPFLAVRTRSADETARLGRTLGEILRPGEVLLLVGDLGTGKTTFVQGLAQGMGIGARPRSPTFVMVNIYEGGTYPLVHADLYRCSSFGEVAGLGLEELFEAPSVGVVEWGERATAVAGDNYLELDFAWDEDDEVRIIRFVPVGRWTERTGELSEAVNRWANSGEA